MKEPILSLARGLLAVAASLDWLPPLLIRLFVGYFFFRSGLGKAQNLAKFTQDFAGWGIPFPAFNAVLSAYTECIGGALILVGLATRLVSIAMIINMIVAITVVKFKEVHSLTDFVNLDEPLYGLSFFWLMISGPGCVSLDYLIARAVGL
jgi:putative oxidoreductase